MLKFFGKGGCVGFLSLDLEYPLRVWVKLKS